MEDVAAAKSLDMLTYMYNYGLEGNVVDHTWYEIFRLRKGIPEEGEEQLFGKPHLEAIILLSDIVYWYRPKVEKDHNGKISLAKKFSADILQRSYSQIESAFGLTDREAKSAMLTLEFYGVARRVFRTITVNGLKLSNVMYIAFDPIKLKDLMLSALEKRSVEEEEGKNGKEELKKIQTYDVQTSHPPRSNVTPPTFKRHTYTETSSETSSEKNLFVAPAPVGPSRSKVFVGVGNDRQEIDQSIFYSKIIAKAVSWSSSEITYSWEAMCSYKGQIRDWWRFVEGTVEKYRIVNKSKNALEAQGRQGKNTYKERKEICKTNISQEGRSSKSDYSIENSTELPSQKLTCLGDYVKEFLHG